MRIADRFKYDLFMYQFSTVKGNLDRIQEQIAKQKKVLRPSDDPIAYSISVDLQAESILYEQMDRNILRVTTFGRIYDTTFSTMKDHLTEAKAVAVDHASGSMDDALRENAVNQVESIIEQLVALGNTVVGDTYVFGGKQSNVAPFRLNPDYSVDFTVPEGSDGGNEIYVDRGNTAQYNISGREAFYERSKTLYEKPANAYEGKASLNTTELAFVVDATNNTIYRNGTAITLTQGIYTGATLASEIQTRLDGVEAGHIVAYDASTRRFTIANNTNNDVSLDWSDPGSTAGQMLGFNPTNSTLSANGGRDTSDMDTGRTSLAVRITDAGLTTGAARAQYEYSTDGGTTWSGPVTVNTGGADVTPDITINATNSTLYRNGSAINLTAGSYTGDTLAAEIQAQLNAVQPGHVVSYNGTSRKFTITNGTGAPVEFDWSNPGSTAAGVLGYDTVDSWLGVGEADVSDSDAGMFIDGSGVVNATNRGVKIGFGTTGSLATGDTFEIKDYSIFEMLKDLRDSLEQDDSAWSGAHIEEIDDGLDVIRRNTAYVGTNLQTMDTLTEANKARQERTAKVISETMDADLAQLAAEYNNLSTVYQSLMYSFTKIQELGLLNFLK